MFSLQGKSFNFYGTNNAQNQGQQAVAGPKVEIINYQTPFQPASSPASLSSRYMKWNLIGIVRREEHSQNEDVEDNENGASITAEFHDSTFHHAMHLIDDHGNSLRSSTTFLK